MDSKYNEYLYCKSYKDCSKMVDFIYSWLGKYCIDKATRKILDNEEYEGG